MGSEAWGGGGVETMSGRRCLSTARLGMCTLCSQGRGWVWKWAPAEEGLAGCTPPHPMIPALLRAKARLAPGTLLDQTARMTQGSAIPAAHCAGRCGACKACIREHVTLATVWEACLLFPLVLPMTHAPLPDLQPQRVSPGVWEGVLPPGNSWCGVEVSAG